MNNLKTTVNVTCSQSGKVAPYNGKVIGQLGKRILDALGVEVGFKYTTEDGAALMSGATIYTWAEANTLWEAVKGNVPADATFEEMMDIAFISAFKIEMATTFGIAVSEIEIM